MSIYKNFIETLYEAKGTNQMIGGIGGKKSDPSNTKRSLQTYKEDESKIVQLLKDKGIADTYKLSDEDLRAVSRMATKAIKYFESDGDGNDIDITKQDGIGSMSQKFENINSNKLYESLYMLMASLLTDYDLPKGYDTLPFELMGGVGGSLEDIANMDSDLLKARIKRIKKPARLSKRIPPQAFNDLLQHYFLNAKGGETGTGKDVDGVGTKGHGRANKLIGSLEDIHQRYFDSAVEKGNLYGQNVGGVKEENEEIKAFFNAAVTKSTIAKAHKKVIQNIKDVMHSTFGDNLKSVVSKLKDADKTDEQIEEITATAKDLYSEVEEAKTLEDIMSAVKGVTGRKTGKGARQDTTNALTQIFGPLKKSLFGSSKEQDLKLPIDVKYMKQIMASLWKYNPELIDSPSIQSFIALNYEPQEEKELMDFYKTFKRKLERGKSYKDEPLADISDVNDIAKDAGIPVATAKDKGGVPYEKGAINSSSFYDMMLDYINE